MKIKLDFNQIDPANGKEPQALIVVLHGLGDQKDQYHRIYSRFASEFPDARVIVPNGFQSFDEGLPGWGHYIVKKKLPRERYEQAQQGYSWFTLNPLTLPYLVKSDKIDTVGKLNDFLTSSLEEANLADDRLIIFGFSQGGMIAIMAATRRAQPCAGVIAHSSTLPASFQTAVNPPLDLIKGDLEMAYDSKLTFKLINMTHERTLQRLNRMNMPYNDHVVKNLGHTISEDSLKLSVDIIKKRLGITAQP